MLLAYLFTSPAIILIGWRRIWMRMFCVGAPSRMSVPPAISASWFTPRSVAAMVARRPPCPKKPRAVA